MDLNAQLEPLDRVKGTRGAIAYALAYVIGVAVIVMSVGAVVVDGGLALYNWLEAGE